MLSPQRTAAGFAEVVAVVVVLLLVVVAIVVIFVGAVAVVDITAGLRDALSAMTRSVARSTATP